ncbi:MAG TPA: helix-turn-helix transcriptional regulator [Polyangiaceae bacterium]|jgi:AraC-like DNA-binding protein|nr:helix-turn-helix transcriptional regulator [Polyangiaceae bacterium]
MVVARFVEDVRTLATPHVRHFPDGRTSLVLRVTGANADLTIMGPRTRASFKNVSNLTRAISVRLKPGWAAALGISACEAANGYIKLRDVWGRAGDELCERMVEATTTAKLIEDVSNAIAARAAFESASAWIARRAARMLQSAEPLRVEEVASHLGVTSRHLRRAFLENVGIAPKDFARSVRLQRVLHLTATTTDWPRIASAAGYYDQAHLIGDFRDLVGITPAAFVNLRETQSPPSGSDFQTPISS